MATLGLFCALKAEPLKLGTKHWSSKHTEATRKGEENKDLPSNMSTTPLAKRTFSQLEFVSVFVRRDSV
jgi:hypothetical protein